MNSPGKETLGATCVSSTWETFVRESQTCMSKIEVKIIGRKYFLKCQHKELKDELKMLSASQRRYQNLTFYAQRPGFLTQELIGICQRRKGKWKQIKVWSEKFDGAELEQFFHSFQEKVESLDLRNLKIVELPEEPDMTINLIDMKRLRDLRLCNVTPARRLISKLTCSHLELLEIENGCDETLISFIAASKTIRALWMTEVNWKGEFLDALSKLTSLKISEIRIKALTAQAEDFQRQLKNLLVSQADYLEVLSFDVDLGSDVLRTVFNLPNLKVLNISTPPSELILDYFPTNSTITELRLKYNCNLKDLWNIIKLTPNLKVLEVASVRSEKKVEDLIEIWLPGLEKLEIN